MNRLLKIIFFGLIVKPLVLIGLGLNTYHRNKLPMTGPAILAPNHNSHLDTLVLISLYPLSRIHQIRPVAAADYFLSNRILAWFSLNVLGIIPLERNNNTGVKEDLFKECHAALKRNEILIIFPEGSRGSPEKLGTLKKGIYHLLKDEPTIPLFPIVMHGLGKALPRGEALLVPFNCDVAIGDPLYSQGHEINYFMQKIIASFESLLEICLTRQA